MLRKSTKASAALIATGIILLLTGLVWSPIILPAFTPDQGGSDGLSFFPDDVDIMEGRISLPSIAWDAMEEDPAIEDLGPEDLDPVWRNIRIRSDGTYDASSGEFLFDSDDFSFDADDSLFPTGGVGKRDYRIYNEYLERNVTAYFEGTNDVLGMSGYSYVLDIDGEEIGGSDILTSFMSGDEGAGSDDDEFSSFLEEGGTRYFYSDSSRFILDPRTSIPLDLELNIGVDMKLPDTTILTVREEDVRYAEEDIWVESGSIPGTREKVEVIKEIRTNGRIDPNDDSIGLYDMYTIYYDRQTGERLSNGEYDEVETFAVDRSSYQYITGYYGTLRSGHFEFPVGNVENRDYVMWDEFSESENLAEYSGSDERYGMEVKIFRMISEDVEVDSGNAVLPIYLHPATVYLLDTVQTWYLDARTGFMIDFHILGSVKVASSGPFGAIETEVADFEVHLPENTTSMLRDVADLFHRLVIPLSNKELTAFGLRISFTDEISGKFVELAGTVGTILDATEIWIPRGIFITAVIAILAGLSILIIRRKRNHEPQYEYAESYQTGY
ncbi:MAG: porin PorA family protein [Thermoplasmatota archaeon]